MYTNGLWRIEGTQTEIEQKFELSGRGVSNERSVSKPEQVFEVDKSRVFVVCSQAIDSQQWMAKAEGISKRKVYSQGDLNASMTKFLLIALQAKLAESDPESKNPEKQKTINQISNALTQEEVSFSFSYLDDDQQLCGFSISICEKQNWLAVSHLCYGKNQGFSEAHRTDFFNTELKELIEKNSSAKIANYRPFSEELNAIKKKINSKIIWDFLNAYIFMNTVPTAKNIQLLNLLIEERPENKQAECLIVVIDSLEKSDNFFLNLVRDLYLSVDQSPKSLSEIVGKYIDSLDSGKVFSKEETEKNLKNLIDLLEQMVFIKNNQEDVGSIKNTKKQMLFPILSRLNIKNLGSGLMAKVFRTNLLEDLINKTEGKIISILNSLEKKIISEILTPGNKNGFFGYFDKLKTLIDLHPKTKNHNDFYKLVKL